MSREKMKNFKNLRIFFKFTQEELAKKLELEQQSTIALYESNNYPSFKILKKMTEIYNLSFDYIILNNECHYLRNLKLLKLAKKLDISFQSQARSHIETTAESFLKQKSKIDLKLDSIDIKLTNDFHANLKKIRKIKNLKQGEIATLLNIGRTAVTLYEKNIYPAIEKLIKLSKVLNVSMHALATGEKLFFDFQDRPFGKTMLLADQLLPLEQHKILIILMENIIN